MKRRHKKQIFPLLIAGLRPADRSSPFLPNSLLLQLLPPPHHLDAAGSCHPRGLPAIQTLALDPSPTDRLPPRTPPARLPLPTSRGRPHVPSPDGALHGSHGTRGWSAFPPLVPRCCRLPLAPFPPSPRLPRLLPWRPGRDRLVAREHESRGAAQDGRARGRAETGEQAWDPLALLWGASTSSALTDRLSARRALQAW